MSIVNFIKMHGCGNDFVIIDGRKENYHLTRDRIQQMTDRHKGIGCDQLIIIENSNKADCFMRIFNADGSEAGACGNAARCIAKIIMQETQQDNITIETIAALLTAYNKGGDMVAVDMGEPKFAWQDIPLAHPQDTLSLTVSEGDLKAPSAVNMGNPHIVFFVADIDHINLAELGPRLEHNKLFPEAVNVNIAQILDSGRIKLRVWERGAGETLACGSGACATLVAAARLSLAKHEAIIMQRGGELYIEWLANNHVIMAGEARESFKGSIGIA